ncbi:MULTISPECIES: DUF4148 domain-containing protein [Paraburkholderia]|jgi:hypothetical protein|uniref:DUF4148 domain-containing protein n=1 Tax=Paraburkholderia phenazinium TaxID=60549 RepID=A0A1N6HVA9_9BURK|nr:DUF4148 domain-containing protein [Paraburkholderia phenazinium]SIO23640.1 protein of unknown function [Paraburkholderia phenazinium]
MKTLIYAALVAGALAAPVLSFAQETTTPITRAEVQADLVRVEQAGYHPNVNDVHYPAEIQAADARLAAQDATTQSDTSVGGVSIGSSQAGTPTNLTGAQSIFAHH